MASCFESVEIPIEILKYLLIKKNSVAFAKYGGADS